MPEPSSAGAAAVQAQEAESSDMITLDPSSGNGLGGNDPAPVVRTEDKILKMLTYRSKPLEGDGTKENPYVFSLCRRSGDPGFFLK